MQEVQAIFTIFRFVYLAWIPVHCSAMSTFFWYSIDLVKELYFVWFLFYSYMCKRNLFTFHSMYKFFIVQIGDWEKFVSTSDAEPIGIFLILECLLVYFITFTMNPRIKSITLNTLMIFSNRLIANFTEKLYYHFLNVKTRMMKKIGELETGEIQVKRNVLRIVRIANSYLAMGLKAIF